MKKNLVIVLLAVFITTVYYASAYEDIEKSVVRMHIIANSDSEEDVRIKLLVRNKILDDMRTELCREATREEVLAKIPELEKSASRALAELSAPYGVKISAERADIPRKEYNGLVLPAGNYTAIRVVLGAGAGENWWCVAYPPLCFTEAVSGGLSEEGEELLRGGLSGESYRIITSDIKYELKITEVAQKLLRAIKGTVK